MYSNDTTPADTLDDAPSERGLDGTEQTHDYYVGGTPGDTGIGDERVTGR